MRGFSLLFFAAFVLTNASAQTVNPAFSVLLNSLLKKSVPVLSVHEAAQRRDALFVDAREAREFSVSHIAGARLVGYSSFDVKSLSDINPDQPLIVYCSVGYRSERVGEQLMAAGFRNVYNLYGGIFEWVNQGLPVVDAQGKATQRVHAYDRMWGVWLQRGEKVF
ncbi:MAG: rhodanese-like domain-containing protein [Chitinophagales bacterium]|nr:rhodanese-like domain-containing protein [Chitinophagales bacterium]MDW8392745.1 rhodanese-like domain-containing protein [Chitinophagales bacterium]